MKKLNSKGYMLVEIILASVLAFGVAYFIINLTIKLKNKNDDLFVDTEVETDRSIITNKLMDDIMKEKEHFDCSKLEKNANTIKYDGKNVDIVNENIDIGILVCSNDSTNGIVDVTIPMSVKQMPDKNYDIKINYYYKTMDNIPPTCKLKQSGNNLIFEYKEDNIGVIAYGILKDGDTGDKYNGIDSLSLADASNGSMYTGYVKDAAGQEGTCRFSNASCILSADLWHYGLDLVHFASVPEGTSHVTLSATDEAGNVDSNITIYHDDNGVGDYAAGLSNIGYSPVKFTGTAQVGGRTATCSIYMVRKSTVTYTRKATPCLYDKYYCYMPAYENPNTTSGYICSDDRFGENCPQIVVDGKPGCCRNNVSYSECYGWIQRKELIEENSIPTFQHMYDYITTETSCTPYDFTCDKNHIEQWKVECSGPSGQACPNGYTEFGNYCYKY